MLAGSADHPVDQMSRAARPPHFTMVHQHVDLERAEDGAQPGAHAPAQRKLTTLTSTTGLKNNASRHRPIREGETAAVNSAHLLHVRRLSVDRCTEKARPFRAALNLYKWQNEQGTYSAADFTLISSSTFQPLASSSTRSASFSLRSFDSTVPRTTSFSSSCVSVI